MSYEKEPVDRLHAPEVHFSPGNRGNLASPSPIAPQTDSHSKAHEAVSSLFLSPSSDKNTTVLGTALDTVVPTPAEEEEIAKSPGLQAEPKEERQ